VTFTGSIRRDTGQTERAKFWGTQDTAFAFTGDMEYETELIRGGFLGSAKRVHNICEIDRIVLSAPKITIDAADWKKVNGTWDRRLPQELRNDFDIEQKNNMYVVSLKKDREKMLNEAFYENPAYDKNKDAKNFYERWAKDPAFAPLVEMARQLQPALRNREEYTLRWELPEDIRKANMRIIPKNTSKDIGVAVKDHINSESRFLYTNILKPENMKVGAKVRIDAEDLEAMIHPDFHGRLDGKVIAEVSRIENKRPEGHGEPITGWKLTFIKDAQISDRNLRNNLKYVYTDVGGTPRYIQLNDIGKTFTGELWLDSNYQIVRYGKMECKNTDYEGKLPKIGNLNNIDLEDIKAKVSFTFTYNQSVSKAD